MSGLLVNMPGHETEHAAVTLGQAPAEPGLGSSSAKPGQTKPSQKGICLGVKYGDLRSE